jgi:hypothetical protein
MDKSQARIAPLRARIPSSQHRDGPGACVRIRPQNVIFVTAEAKNASDKRRRRF